MKAVSWSPLAFGACLLLFTACSTLKVSTDYDHSVDFSAYKSFALTPESEQMKSVR
ncbi:MAG: hypothetical protein RMK52_03220 [Chitinophagales bacterium]|nr:hypothetical protein [Chitinophagales bacterium]MDW8393236.1 hypothetical protein [Chitinophagales bacterium]